MREKFRQLEEEQSKLHRLFFSFLFDIWMNEWIQNNLIQCGHNILHNSSHLVYFNIYSSVKGYARLIKCFFSKKFSRHREEIISVLTHLTEYQLKIQPFSTPYAICICISYSPPRIFLNIFLVTSNMLD